MAAERHDADAVREFRLEGFTLFVIVALIVASLTGSFFLGRWYERRNASSTMSDSALADDPLANVVEMEEPADVDESAGFFDTMEGEQKQAEPGREAAPPAARTPSPPPPAESAPARPAKAAEGGFFVQIVAVRDRSNAERLMQELRGKGYPVKLFSEAEGSGALYKVRVGGYPAENDARKAAQQLIAGGYQGAFVTRPD